MPQHCTETVARLTALLIRRRGLPFHFARALAELQLAATPRRA
jgi:hypothetical protein